MMKILFLTLPEDSLPHTIALSSLLTQCLLSSSLSTMSSLVYSMKKPANLEIPVLSLPMYSKMPPLPPLIFLMISQRSPALIVERRAISNPNAMSPGRTLLPSLQIILIIQPGRSLRHNMDTGTGNLYLNLQIQV